MTIDSLSTWRTIEQLNSALNKKNTVWIKGQLEDGTPFDDWVETLPYRRILRARARGTTYFIKKNTDGTFSASC